MPKVGKIGLPLTMKNTRLKPIVLTIITDDDIKCLKNGSSWKDIRKRVTQRMFDEAIEQGAVLNHVDVSLLLKCPRSTIERYIKEIENEKNVRIMDRGKIHDLGRAVSHKKEAVRLMLTHYSQPEIKRRIHHSGKAVDRYLRDYNRVNALKDKHTPKEIAFATGLSLALVNEYLDLIEEMEGKGGKTI